jgi:hypothetical protein
VGREAGGMEAGAAGLVFGEQKIPEGIAGRNGGAGGGESLWRGAARIRGGEGGADRGGGIETAAMDGKEFGRTTEGRPREGEDGVATQTGNDYDIEMDCATVGDGQLDQRIELLGEQGKMSDKLSIVRTDPFPFLFQHCDLRDHPCDNPDDENYPAKKDGSSCNKMDNKKKCSDATEQDVDDCLARNPYSDGAGLPGDNCQSNTLDRLGKCCLGANWNPSWYAFHPVPPPFWMH